MISLTLEQYNQLIQPQENTQLSASRQRIIPSQQRVATEALGIAETNLNQFLNENQNEINQLNETNPNWIDGNSSQAIQYRNLNSALEDARATQVQVANNIEVLQQQIANIDRISNDTTLSRAEQREWVMNIFQVCNFVLSATIGRFAHGMGDNIGKLIGMLMTPFMLLSNTLDAILSKLAWWVDMPEVTYVSNIVQVIITTLQQMSGDIAIVGSLVAFLLVGLFLYLIGQVIFNTKISMSSVGVIPTFFATWGISLTAVDNDELQRQTMQQQRATLAIAYENMTSDRRESIEVQQARAAYGAAVPYQLRQTWWQYLTKAEDPLRAAITSAQDADRASTSGGGKKTKKRKRNRKHRKSSKKNKKNSNKRSKKNKKNSKRNKRSRKK
jgi:hypothetical protein